MKEFMFSQVIAYEKYFISQISLYFPAEEVLILHKQSVYDWTETAWTAYFIKRIFFPLNCTQNHKKYSELLVKLKQI